ncbi:hypothetical protein MTO96_041471 [Rhipicephalus appendiculatus]
MDPADSQRRQNYPEAGRRKGKGGFVQPSPPHPAPPLPCAQLPRLRAPFLEDKVLPSIHRRSGESRAVPTCDSAIAGTRRIDLWATDESSGRARVLKNSSSTFGPEGSPFPSTCLNNARPKKRRSPNCRGIPFAQL